MIDRGDTTERLGLPDEYFTGFGNAIDPLTILRI
jgi:hypothetical protein